MGNKWKIANDRYENGIGIVLGEIDRIAIGLEEKTFLHKENSYVLEAIIRETFGALNMSYDLRRNSGGFVMKCPSKGIDVAFGPTRNAGTWIVVRTSKWNKGTSSVCKAVSLFNKAVKESCLG